MRPDPFPTPRGALSPEGVTAGKPQEPEPPTEAGRRLALLDLMRRMDCQDLFDDAFYALVQYERSLGVPGYVGAKGAVPEPRFSGHDGLPPHRHDGTGDITWLVAGGTADESRFHRTPHNHAKGAVPEPQGPTTEAGRRFVERHGTGKQREIIEIEREARRSVLTALEDVDWGSIRADIEAVVGAAPAEIDAVRMARAIHYTGIANCRSECLEPTEFESFSGADHDMASMLIREYRRLASPDATRREPTRDLSRTPEDMDR